MLDTNHNVTSMSSNFESQRKQSASSTAETQRNMLQAKINMINAAADYVVPLSGWHSKLQNFWNKYEWRMRHYFYVHLLVFFCNSLLCGAIIWRIEQTRVPYIDCWFMSATCVFTCGLETYEFPLFSIASQVLLLFFTVISGITVSTLPAVFIKLYYVKQDIASDEETNMTIENENDLPIQQIVLLDSSDETLNQRLRQLPNPKHLRSTAYIIIIVLILSTCMAIYLSSFLAIGFWLKYQYDPQYLARGNKTVNSFYASLVITLTGFNQNGLTPWKGSMPAFTTDIFMNIVIMLLVMSGTSLFPAILRGIVGLLKNLVPWRHKIYFDYILLNNHRLSAVIFPSVQTRLYVMITILLQILGVGVSLINDFHEETLVMYSGGQRFMIFMFQTVNTRFAGFNSIDITKLSAGTLLIFILLMGVKPQMLCAINDTPFEMEWILLQTQEKLENGVSNGNEHDDFKIFLPFDRMKNYLQRKSSITRAQANRYFASTISLNRIETAFEKLNEQRNQQCLNVVSPAPNFLEDRTQENVRGNIHIPLLRMKLFLITFCRHVILSLFSLLKSTRTWLFIFIFLICTFESSRMTPSDPTVTVFRVIFETVSAFGGCGLSMGLTDNAPSLAAVLHSSSKIVLIFVMCMGRHRGLLDSMKDQEEIEYSAQILINSWKQSAILKHREKRGLSNEKYKSATTINTSTSTLSTRF